MKIYIDTIFKKEKKPISLERLYEKISELLGREITDEEMSLVQQELEEGLDSYQYYRSTDGHYTLLQKTSYRVGRFHGTRAGDGFVIVNSSYTDKNGDYIPQEDKYTIAKDRCGDAIDGDFVCVQIGNKPKVEKVLQRNLGDVTGVITRVGASYFVTPLDKKKQGLTIALEGSQIEGQIVSVSLSSTRGNNFYIGKIKETFRHKDDPNEQALLEAFRSGMPEGFSEESLEQEKHIPTVVTDEDKIGRYDFTDWEVFSIDGADTKDKDDCISLKKLPNGNYLLGVHIADVPHYVPTGSPIHKDAFRKGTSYYFGGCVEPQLPRTLSNGICSLVDKQERLCKTILMEYTPDGKIVSRSLVKSVINSNIGMTYEKVNNILKNGIVDSEYEPHKETLLAMAKFAKTMRQNRIANGAIEFNRPEKKFIHDDKGKAIGVTLRHQDVSENLIEEFMLAGNVNVFEILTEKGIPCPYRVHASPNEERLTEFLRLLKVIGMPFPYSASDICKDKTLMQELSLHIRKNEELYPMLSTNLIRTFSHAMYSPINIGHYGAAFATYGHFTSPIRRLADDTVSRIIDDCYFEKDPEKKSKAIRKWKKWLPEFCAQASKMEKIAEQVERNVEALDTAVMLHDHEGEEFEGTVVSINNTSLAIQLDNLLEGKVRIVDLPGKYVYNAQTFTLLSTDGLSHYYIGDRLKLRLKSSNIETKSVDFEVIEKIRENPINNGDVDVAKIMQKRRGKKQRGS